MPLTQLGQKKYYLGIFFKVCTIFPVFQTTQHLQANWYKAEQYCRFHGMHLASINSAEEQQNLEEHIQSFGELRLGYSLLIFGWNLVVLVLVLYRVKETRYWEIWPALGLAIRACLDIGV